MVILGRELKPGGGGGWQAGADARLLGAAIATAAPGVDLESQVQWYNEVLGLQLISLGDGDAALLSTGVGSGAASFEIPTHACTLLAPTKTHRHSLR